MIGRQLTRSRSIEAGTKRGERMAGGSVWHTGRHLAMISV